MHKHISDFDQKINRLPSIGLIRLSMPSCPAYPCRFLFVQPFRGSTLLPLQRVLSKRLDEAGDVDAMLRYPWTIHRELLICPNP